jgi:exopolyphosphatase/guanosine-5'-triphosphate,3'-diphosphate pyrophosphatase
MFIGIVDLSADSIRLSIYKHENREFRLLFTKQSFIGLLGYAEDGVLTQKGINTACTILRRFRTLLNDFNVEQAYAYASAELRSIPNCMEFLQRIRDDTEFIVDQLSGDNEARLSYDGAMRETEWDSGLFVGISGASTDLVSFTHRQINRAMSIPYGSLNLSLKYIKGVTPHKSNILDMKQELKRELKRTKLFEFDESYDLCATGVSASAAIKLYNDIYDLDDDNTIMEAAKFNSFLGKYYDDRRDFIKRIRRLVPDRIFTVIPGIVILNLIAAMSQSRFINVSFSGTREGYICERICSSDESVMAPVTVFQT